MSLVKIILFVVMAYRSPDTYIMIFYVPFLPGNDVIFIGMKSWHFGAIFWTQKPNASYSSFTLKKINTKEVAL